MAYQPQGFLFQPPMSLALTSCPPFSSSSGSAFAPYSGSASSHLSYGGESRTAGTLSAFMSPGYDPSSGISGSLDYHPFGALGPYPYGDAAYRKNATRDATATLKAWLNEHRKNPYPTKGEKIMLAIITKMTLTQVSTWFANARRRLKKENKMTWTPRNRSEDEEEEDIDLERDDEESMKANSEEPADQIRSGVCPASSVSTYRDDGGGSSDTDRGFTDPDRRPPRVPDPAPSHAPLAEVSASEAEPTFKENSCNTAQGPSPAPKPKLWSLAEIATSTDKSSKRSSDLFQSGVAGPQAALRIPHSPALPRHLYYTSPFIPAFSSYGPLGPLPGSSPLAAVPHLNGLQQTVLQRAEILARDCRIRGHELKKGVTNT